MWDGPFGLSFAGADTTGTSGHAGPDAARILSTLLGDCFLVLRAGDVLPPGAVARALTELARSDRASVTVDGVRLLCSAAARGLPLVGWPSWEAVLPARAALVRSPGLVLRQRSRQKESLMSKPGRDRSSADVAALILRLTVGPMMILHGLNKVRGPGGLEGTTRYFESLGLEPAAVHARVAATTEIGTGALLTVGAFTPLASAGVIGVMTAAAATDHKGKGFFIFKGGWEYVGVVGATAAAISALGPGRYSCDGACGRGRGGFRSALFSTVLGVAAALGLLSTRRRPEDAPAGSGD